MNTSRLVKDLSTYYADLEQTRIQSLITCSEDIERRLDTRVDKGVAGVVIRRVQAFPPFSITLCVPHSIQTALSLNQSNLSDP